MFTTPTRVNVVADTMPRHSHPVYLRKKKGWEDRRKDERKDGGRKDGRKVGWMIERKVGKEEGIFRAMQD